MEALFSRVTFMPTAEWKEEIVCLDPAPMGPLEAVLPEVAYMKLGWAFGKTDDLEKVKEIMLTPINGEITEREPSNGYLIYQGGLPEVEEFIKQYRK